MIDRLRPPIAAAFLMLAILLGGATRGAPIAWAAVELLAIATLALAMLRPAEAVASPAERAPRRLLIAAGATMLIYLIPLPPALWSVLPGRGIVREGYALLGIAPPWLPLALAPHAAVASALALLPAAAGYAAVARGGRRAPGFASAAICLGALASALLGMLQLLLGAKDRLLLYGDLQSIGGGLFANANHNATMALCGILLLAGLAAHLRTSARRERHAAIGMELVLAAAGIVLLLGVVLAGSIAGLLLLVPTLAGALLIYRNGQPGAATILTGIGATGAVVVGVVLALLSPRVTDFARTARTGGGGIARPTFWHNTLRAIGDHLPFGSGPGSFTAVYPRYEDPATVTNIFVNHAHSDWLEVVLETGVIGTVLLGLFLIWWVGRVRAAWSPGTARAPLARAATLATGVMMAHSLIDYPLRTAGLMATFAGCCAIMALPQATALPSPEPRRRRTRRSPRHISA